MYGRKRTMIKLDMQTIHGKVILRNGLKDTDETYDIRETTSPQDKDTTHVLIVVTCFLKLSVNQVSK